MVKQIVAVLAAVTLVTAGGSQVAYANRNFNNNQHNRWVKLAIEKEWTVAEDPSGLFSEQDVEVQFDVKVFRNWKLKYSKTIDAGDKIWVKKGSVVKIEEQVTGLDELCSYEADDLKTFVKSRKRWQKHTVTNTVTCDELPEDPEEPEEEEEGEVLAEVTEEEQVEAPVGAVDAGVGGAGLAASSLIGLGGSLSAVGYGARRLSRRK